MKENPDSITNMSELQLIKFLDNLQKELAVEGGLEAFFARLGPLIVELEHRPVSELQVEQDFGQFEHVGELLGSI
jgi:hypothetical protein